MQIKNATDVRFVTAVTSRRPPSPELVCIAKGKFNLCHGGRMTLVEGLRELAQGPLGHDVYAPDDDERERALLVPSDFAEFKPHGEVMLTGSCHSPRGRSVRELGVVLEIGRFQKALVVQGDRDHDKALPKRFASLPLGYAQAYGGDGYPPNPIGKGHGTGALPNVTDPSDVSALPRPASFAPINPGWPQRARRMGSKYDQDYFDKRFPFYPEDFDWRFFQAAPASQWIEGFWRGDEQVVLENLHREHARLETQLPGLRIRAFVKDDRAVFREVKMVLDTIFIDSDAAVATLTWRGHTPIRKVLATDVATILVVQETLADAATNEDGYRAQLEAFEQDPLGIEDALPDEMKDMQAQLDDKMGEPMGETEQGRRVGAMLQQRMGTLAAGAQQKVVAAIDRAAQEAPEASAQLDEAIGAVESMDDDDGPDAIPPYVPMSAAAKPRVYLRHGIVEARERTAAARLQLVDAIAHADPTQRAEAEAHLAVLDDNAKRLYDPQLEQLDPTLREVSTDEPGPGADLRGQDLARRDLRGFDLRGARLDGAILTRANLRGCDLTGASLQGTVLYRADLTDAALLDCNLDQINAAEATLEGADLSGSTVHEAYFKGATMTRCRMDRVRGAYVGFPESDLTELSMTDADVFHADFRDACLQAANLRGSQVGKALFHKAKAQRICLDGAKLDQTSFLQSDLSHASLVGVRGERTSFLQAKLEATKLSRAVLIDALFDDVNAADAQFIAADLRRARLPRAGLDRARFDRANLMQCDLTDAEVDTASFRSANLYDAKLLRTSGKNVDMTGAELTLTRTNGAV